MSTTPSDPNAAPPTDSPRPTAVPLPFGIWAPPVDRLRLESPPSGAINANVEGRQLVGALQGFGPLWQKRYRVRLSGADVTPADVMDAWRAHFSSFWPSGNRFYTSLTQVAPGEIALINLTGPMGIPLSTGVMVIYADETSFTFMCPQGHPFAGWITFSAYEEAGTTVAQSEVLIRTNDPLWEIAARLFVFRQEDAFWRGTLRALAGHFGVEGQVQEIFTCLDPRFQWSRASNVRYNAVIHTGLYLAATPVRWTRRNVRRRWRRNE